LKLGEQSKMGFGIVLREMRQMQLPKLPTLKDDIAAEISKNTLVLVIDSVHEEMTIDLLMIGAGMPRSLHREISPKHKHDTLVATLVKDVFEKVGIKWSDITAYAVNTGPGSWIGSRVGIAAIKAFNLVHPKPIIALDSIAVDGVEIIGAGTDKGIREVYMSNMFDVIVKKFNAKEFTTMEELEPFYGKEYVVQKWTPKN